MKSFPIAAQIIVLSLLSLFSLSAGAEGIGMVTGSKTGTYFQFGNDIADMVKTAGVDILVKESQGSIDNIKRLDSRENAAFGIVQSDVLGFLSRSAKPGMKKIASRIRLIFPFYNEEIHLFARKSIQQFSDLQGQRLVVGETSSGNWLTAMNLLQMTNVRPAETLNLPPLKAVTAVLEGKADAMIYVAGKPVALFTKLGNLKEKPEYAPLFENVHFVPLQDATMLQEYETSSIGPDDYAWITESTPTIAVKAVLMSFDFSSRKSAYYRQRCDALANIGRSIRNNIGNLKKNGHPKWREVDLEATTGNWKLDACSRSDGDGKGQTDITSELEKVLLNEFR
jgi:TRAP transporter TAXI family solute receptor